jgi:type II secretory ATPase GspE/PulE/Tfp pilus assembly ATPase PilB-like protein
MGMTRRRLGDLLLEAGVVDREQLQAALDRRRHTGERLGQALVSLGYLREETIARALAEQLDLDFLESPEDAPACAPPGTIGEADSRRYRAVPLGDRGGRLLMALSDPLNAFAVEQLAYSASRPIALAVCTDDTLDRILDRYYPKALGANADRDRLRSAAVPSRFGSRLSGARPGVSAVLGKNPASLDDRAGPATVNRLLLQAVASDATEVHLEPAVPGGRVRCRAGGVLREIATLPKELFGSVLAHVRGMAGLDLTEIGATGEGWFEHEDDDYELSIRAVYLRLPGGDRAVLHLVDRQRPPASLLETGMDGEVLAGYRQLLRLPAGLVLVASPHEAQLRSLLRATVASVNDPAKLVAFLESSPGRHMPGVMHIAWGAGRTLDARGAAKAAGGQDADVVVVSGPIADRQAAPEIVSLALSGRLVVAGVEAASPAEAILRFELNGVARDVMANVCRGVLSHRTARCICKSCLGGAVLQDGATVTAKAIRQPATQRAGCAQCEWTGYQGTVGIFELAVVTPEQDSIAGLCAKVSFAADARAKVLSGITDETEAARCLGNRSDCGAHPGLLAAEQVVD